LIEDCAQAQLAEYKGRPVGELDDGPGTTDDGSWDALWSVVGRRSAAGVDDRRWRHGDYQSRRSGRPPQVVH
jgi:hypothetical protein